MIRFPRTSASRPLSRAELPRRARDLRFQSPECLSKLKGFGRVAVVGGGLAGLMAARRLVQHGVKVTVFEARKEVGGRVLSNRTFSAGRIAEEGAELIGSFHTRWLELAREFGLAMISRMDPDLYERACLDVKLTLDEDLSMAEFKALSHAMDERVLTPLAELAKLLVDPSQPWKQTSLKYRNQDWQIAQLDNMSVQQALPKFCQISERNKNPGDERLWKMLEFKLVNDEVAPLHEMNFLGLLCKVRGGQGERCVEHPNGGSSGCDCGYWDELEIFRCADGCQELATKMAAKIQTKNYGPEPATVKTLTAVTHIALSAKAGVTLGLKRTLPNGKFVDDKPSILVPGFSYVILATPPSVWHRATITADGRDADPAKGIGPMHMIDAVKYFSDLKERFWIKERPAPNRDRGSAPYGGSLRIGQVWEGTDNQTRVGNQGVLLSVFAGPVANGRVPTRDEFDKELRRLYRGYAGNLTQRPLHSDWPNVPFIKTGYWSPRPGDIFKVGEKLTKPYHHRLFFAGEHTQMDFFGYMEGALRSGERAAETLMLSACGLIENTAPKPGVRSPQRPAPKPPLVARTTPAHEAESPFLGVNLLPPGAEEAWEPRVVALAEESPFAGALDEVRGRFDEDQFDGEQAPDALEAEEASEAAEVWEELPENEPPLQAGEEEDESLEEEGAPLPGTEANTESAEELEEQLGDAVPLLHASAED